MVDDALMMHLHLLVASEAADVTILGGELLLIPKAIGIRKGT
nr:hypothetical protein [Lentibacillus salicampi]